MIIRIGLLGLLVLLAAGGANPQSHLPLPEQAANHGGKPLHIMVRQDSVPTPLPELATADFIARGRLVRLKSYLSKDGHHVWTDYELVPTKVILDKEYRFTVERKPGQISPLIVTL